MTKYKIDNEFIEAACQKLKDLYGGKWTGKNEQTPTMEFKVHKKVKGQIFFDDVNLDIKGDVLNKEFDRLLTIVKGAEKNKIKAKELEKSIFKNLYTNENRFNGLPLNRDLLKKIEVELRKFDIGEIKIREPLSEERTFVSTSVLLGIENSVSGTYDAPGSGFYERLKTFFLKKYTMRDYDKDSFSLSAPNFFPLLQNEKVEKLEIDETLVGTYYPERNFIHLYYNPFIFEKINVFTADIPLALKDLFKLLRRLKIKKNDITDIQKRLLISAFAKKSKEKEKHLKDEIKSNERRIGESGKSIRDCIERIHSDIISLEFIKSLMHSSGEHLFKEIDKMNLLSFIKDVKIGSGVIDILYKATSMPIPDMKRGDTGKGFGKRFIYIGEIGFRISPGDFKMYGNCPIKNSNPHPHGEESENAQNSSPCFGDGEAHSKIYRLLAEYKFSELAKMLWFWIKTYRNKGAYVKVWETYDDRLKKGYPVFDEKGKRIEINEKERLKSGEQVKLTPTKEYKDNIKKYKNVKL